jgi:hypothetical protein
MILAVSGPSRTGNKTDRKVLALAAGLSNRFLLPKCFSAIFNGYTAAILLI